MLKNISSSPALSNVKHLKLDAINKNSHNFRTSLELKALVNGIFWECDPVSLLLIPRWGSNYELIELLCRKLTRSDSLIAYWRPELRRPLNVVLCRGYCTLLHLQGRRLWDSIRSSRMV
jgi:hypothetical protein